MAQKAEHTAPARSAKRSSQSAKPSPEDLRSWEQVNQRLASLGEAERQIRSLQDQFEQKVAVLKQQWLEASHPVVRDKEKIEGQIERFYWAHRDEVLALVRNVAAHEREQHPLHRVMQIEEALDGVVVTTTDIHLPQRIAEALKHAYHGEFKLRYGHDEYTVRANWQR